MTSNTLIEPLSHFQYESVWECVCFVPTSKLHLKEYVLSLQPPAKFLLPEVSIADYGKNCVVIDLDETLVHSSFKVIYHSIPFCNTKITHKSKQTPCFILLLVRCFYSAALQG